MVTTLLGSRDMMMEKIAMIPSLQRTRETEKIIKLERGAFSNSNR